MSLARVCCNPHGSSRPQLCTQLRGSVAPAPVGAPTADLSSADPGHRAPATPAPRSGNWARDSRPRWAWTPEWCSCCTPRIQNHPNKGSLKKTIHTHISSPITARETHLQTTLPRNCRKTHRLTGGSKTASGKQTLILNGSHIFSHINIMLDERVYGLGRVFH